ncbi:MAG: hypothetical protein ACTSP9_16745 [Promethearchaeota archaeon]
MYRNFTTANNRAYLASCLRHFAQITFRGTSDTLGTLGEIAVLAIDYPKNIKLLI